MKIKVDYDLCESNALCEAMAPEVFEVDDDDDLQLKTDETTDANLENVKRAVAACPRAAISLEGLRWATTTVPGRPGRGRHRSRGRPGARRGGGAGSRRGARRTQRPAGCRGRRRRRAQGARRRGRHRRGRRGGAGHRRRDARRRGRGLRPARHRGQQRRHDPRPDAVQPLRRGVGRRHPRPPARALPALAQRRVLLAGAVEGRRRPGLRPDRQHGVRGVPRRLARPGQLRGRQGRHRGAHAVLGPRPGQDRRPRQRDLPARPDGDDRAGLRRGHLRAGGRPLLARPRRAAGRLPRLARRRADHRPGLRRVRRDGRAGRRTGRRAALRRLRLGLGPAGPRPAARRVLLRARPVLRLRRRLDHGSADFEGEV